MGWGFWKKLKSGFQKAGQWIKKAATKLYDKVVKPVFKAGKDLLPIAGAAGAAAAGVPPQAGMTIGQVIKSVGEQIIK